MATPPRAHKQEGFTLIELMIAVAIIAVLIAIALPAYNQHIITAKRSLARAELIKVAARQEQFFVNNKKYASTTLADLGYGGVTYAVNSQGDAIGAAAADRVYVIRLAAAPAATATSYTLEAVPQLEQVKDIKCKTLTLSSLGVKGLTGGATGTVAQCW